ncbi:MAG: portal protein, partial [Akkermansiaceae bacterium]|nr:portal protein [Akkermansiaceae bacterium]
MTGVPDSDYARLALSVLESADKLRPLWAWLARRIMPRTEDALHQIEASPAAKRDLSAVASESMHTLAAAHYSYITPAGMPWFKFKSRDREDDRIYTRWYEHASERTLQELSKSNFYAEVQESYLCRVLYGTALLLCEAKRGGGLLFRNVPVGTFGIAENAEGEIDTVCRRFSYTANQAVQRFGEKNLPELVRRSYARPEARFRDTFEFLHLVTPRKVYTPGNGDALVPAKKRAFASIYFYDGADYPVIEEGGYEEFPFLATRFLRWPGTVWGYAPGFKCMSALNTLMKLENNMDILSDLAAFPRVLKLAEQVGEVDFRAGGQTVVSVEAAQLGFPKEWGTAGRYDVGKDRIQAKEEQIRSAFYVPFLQVISSVDRTMTATEVQARQEEQALSFSPTFTQFTSEMNVMLYRIFACLYRQGALNTASAIQPKKLRVPANDGTENFSVAVPQVHYLGKISQAIEKSQKSGLESFLQILQGFVQATGDSSALDYVDTGRAIKVLYSGTGAPADVLRSDEDVQRIREQREAMQQQQAEAQAAMQQASAV